MAQNGSRTVTVDDQAALDDHSDLDEPASQGSNGTDAAAVAEPVTGTEAETPPSITDRDETNAQREAETPIMSGVAVDHDSASASEDGNDVFLVELVRAMKSTAATERSRLDESTERRRNAHVEAIRAREAAEADQMRELADEDLRGIKAWADAEISRIRSEREQREAALRGDLATSLEQHHAKIGNEIEAVDGAIAAYRASLDAFFDRLENETDPVAIAQHASSYPVYPPLDATIAPAAEQSGPEADSTGNGDTVSGSGPVGDSDSEPAPSSATAEETIAPLIGVMDPDAGGGGAESWASPGAEPVTDGPVSATGASADGPIDDERVEDATASAETTAIVAGSGATQVRTIGGYPVRPYGGILHSVPALRPVSSWLHRDSGDHDREGDR
jgi:hypothetical protein